MYDTVHIFLMNEWIIINLYTSMTISELCCENIIIDINNMIEGKYQLVTSSWMHYDVKQCMIHVFYKYFIN